MFKNIITILFLLCRGIRLSGQETGKAIVYFEPLTAKVLLDGKPYKCSRGTVQLPLGKHYVQAWDSTYKMYNDSFEVNQKGFTIVSKPLKYSELYKDYREKKTVYKWSMVSSRFIFPIIVLGYGGQIYLRHKILTKRIDDYRDAALENKALYESSISLHDLDSYLLRYNGNKKEYDELRLKHSAMLKRSAFIIPTTACASAVLFYFSFKLKRPVYYEAPPALFALQGIGIKPQAETLCLNLNFSIR